MGIEIDEAVASYLALRERIEAGEADWIDLAGCFTDDVVYIDPAWGRVEGIESLREFLVESMAGLEDWRFPVQMATTSGSWAIVKWTQIVPAPRGGELRHSGVSTLRYRGDGRFDYEEDVLNMVHVIEDLTASGWRPGPGFTPPPSAPVRDWSAPSR